MQKTAVKCAECGGAVHESLREEAVPYGSGADAVEIRVTVPVLECAGCRDPYTDFRGEDARSAAVLAHPGENDMTDNVTTRLVEAPIQVQTQMQAWPTAADSRAAGEAAGRERRADPRVRAAMDRLLEARGLTLDGATDAEREQCAFYQASVLLGRVDAVDPMRGQAFPAPRPDRAA